MQAHTRTQLVMLWLGPTGALLLFGGALVSGFLPPPSPADSATTIQHTYVSHATAIRIGMLMMMAACICLGPFVAVISTQMKRIEGRYSPLSYLQMMCGLINNMLGIIPLAFLGVATFRATRSPELVLLLNDVCWLMFFGVFFAGEAELFAIAASAFKDKRQEVFPRWFGWFSLWIPVTFWPLVLVWFTHQGIFTWVGAVCFWFAAIMFFVWLGVTAIVLHRSVVTQGATEADLIPTPVSDLAGAAA